MTREARRSLPLWARLVIVAIWVVAAIIVAAIKNAQAHADPGVFQTAKNAAYDLNLVLHDLPGPDFLEVEAAVDDRAPRDSSGRALVVVDAIDSTHYELTDLNGEHPACLTVVSHAYATDGPCPVPSQGLGLRAWTG